jgi:hypothetical protein
MLLAYFYNNRLVEALEFSKSRLQMFNNYYSMDSHGFLLLQLKQYKEAIYYLQQGNSSGRYPISKDAWLDGSSLRKSRG